MHILNKSTRGAGLVEYGLLAGLVAVVAIASVSELGQKVDTNFKAVDAAMTANLGEDEPSAVDPGVGPSEPETPPTPVLVFYDSIEQSSGWQFSNARTSIFFDTAGWGYESSNAEALHVNNNHPQHSGLHWVNIPAAALSEPGSYRVRITAGNYNNWPFSAIAFTGLRSGGSYLPPETYTRPEPGLGQEEVWEMTYTLTQSQIDGGLSFAIDVPANGQERNASFDDLEIHRMP
jgi:Flp pilus assembly pilin Flp